MTLFAGERVLVIGGLGFIGTNLTARLLDEGAVVTVLTPSLERHADHARVYESAGAAIVEGDIRDHVVLSSVVPSQSTIFNLAGQSGAVRSMADPWTDLDVNCRGTLVLLEAIRLLNPAAKLVMTGSRLQYGRPETNPVSEDERGTPTSLHGIHKSTAEEYARLYHRLYRLRFTVARVTNPFGPGQPGGRTAYGIINRFVHLALHNETLAVYGDGTQRRDYVHVDDVVGALLALARAAASDGRVYNVGSGRGTSLIEVARLIVDIAGMGRVEQVAWPEEAQQIETGDFVADISRIRHDVGWMPGVPLHDGLKRTIAELRESVPAGAEPAPASSDDARGRRERWLS